MRRTRRISEVVVRVAVTALLGGVTYLITNLTDQPEIWKITLSVFIAGATLIVQQLADFERRLDDGLTGFNDTTRLISRLDTSPVGSGEVTRLARNVAALEPGRPDLLYTFVRAEVRRLANLMEALRGNHADYPGEDRDWLLGLARCAGASIDAASTSVDRDFWGTDLGRHYVTAQEQAVSRGVRVRRLLILGTPADLDADVEELRAWQRSLGFEIRVLVLSTLETWEQREAVKNFVVFDRAISYETTPADGDPSRVYETSLTVGERVDERVRRFETWWERGD
ncbi:hypothetical protein GT028_12430 [Streptomyces sp. SID2999]|uniref:hypothetical protein n=1 Tax=Streptomyces sp. SID2999 TaxID=2690258 RepID=UPI0013685CFE|nr:hypothetical protein [Streptomyces sp. SID2999]MYZ08163.1 hypothetical protein [Streptomyces sp. SID2999]